MLLSRSLVEKSDGIVKLMLDGLFQEGEIWASLHEDTKEVRINREMWRHVG
jgi:hypothetical protein